MFRGAFSLRYQIRKDGISNPLRQLRHSRMWAGEISRTPGEIGLHQSGVRLIKENINMRNEPLASTNYFAARAWFLDPRSLADCR